MQMILKELMQTSTMIGKSANYVNGIIKSHKESKGTHSRICNQLLEIRVEAWAASQRSKERRRVQADAPAPVLEAQRCPWKFVSSSENA